MLVALVLATVHVYVLYAAYAPYLSDTCEWGERVRFQHLIFPAFAKEVARCNLTWGRRSGPSLARHTGMHAPLPWDKHINA